MLTTAPDHPDVIPPDDLRPVRAHTTPRGFRLLFVSLLVVLSTVFVGVGSAAALIQLAVPIAATALRIAPSALRVVAPQAAKGMTPMTGALGGGLALAAAGLFDYLTEDEWDEDAIWKKVGIKMPWDAKADLTTGDRNPGTKSAHAAITITGYQWTTYPFEGGEHPTLRIEGTCAPVTSATGYCPANGADAWVGGNVDWQCYEVATGAYRWSVNALQVNARQRDSSGRPPCAIYRNGRWMVDQLVAMMPSNNGSGLIRVTNPEKIMNPDFDPSGATPGAGAATAITATSQCVDPATGVETSYSVTSDGVDTMPVAPCPRGHTPKKSSWVAETPSGAREMGGTEYDFSEFPECADMSCYLQVKVDGIPCQVGVDRCYDWMRVEPKNRVECQFGPYALGLEQCRDLEWAYRSGAGMTPSDAPAPGGAPALNPDGSPNPQAPTRLVPSDPEGKPAPEVAPGTPFRPDPYPPGNPGPNPNPDPPSNPDPTTVQPPPPVWNPPVPGNPPDLDSPAKNCIAAMASWNPVDWVYVPVKCALTWAFVPKTAAVQASVATARSNIDNAGLTAWTNVPGDLMGNIPEGGGCMGPALTMPDALGGRTYYPLNACSDPMSRYADMSRALISVVVVVLGGYAGLNGLSVSLTGYRLIERESKGTVTT